jgi:hypothetical protein
MLEMLETPERVAQTLKDDLVTRVANAGLAGTNSKGDVLVNWVLEGVPAH